MELSTALKQDSYTKEEILLYLQLIQDFFGQFQTNCPSIHDYLCIRAIASGETALTDASNAISSALAILNQEVAVKSQAIALPSTWKAPKFKLGQMTRQGLIVGMQYKPDQPGYPDYEQWTYSIQEGTESCFTEEFKIELLSPEELSSIVRIEIKHHQQQINALQEQLKQALKNQV